MLASTIFLTLAWPVLAFSLVIGSAPRAERENMSPALSNEELHTLNGDPEVTHFVTFSIAQDEENGDVTELGQLKIALFGTVAPITTDNFVQLALGTHGFGYKGSGFHRIIQDFMVQGGIHSAGGKGIFKGGQFDDEDFTVKHEKKGRLSMANAGPNTNGAQFFIVTNPNGTPHLDGHHVVFGQLVGGFPTLDALNRVKTTKDVPDKKVYIKDTKVIRAGTLTKPTVELTEKLTVDEIFGTVPETLKKVSDQPPVHNQDGQPSSANAVLALYGWQLVCGVAVLLGLVYLFVRRGGMRRLQQAMGR